MKSKIKLLKKFSIAMLLMVCKPSNRMATLRWAPSMHVSRTRFSVATALLSSALLSLAGGCSSLAPESTHSAGYKYHTLIRSASGHYRNADVLEPGDTFVYAYGFRLKDLLDISPDLSVAAKTFIERRHGVPPECVNGIKIIATGRGENGGASANAECL